jgi:NAD(P)-dependent dehydrogenase (short-subunit alcohol dehydrogenase family)
MLTGLDAALAHVSRPQALRSLRANFSAPAGHEQPLTWNSSQTADGALQISIKQGGTQIQNIVAMLVEAGADANSTILGKADWRRSPLPLTLAEMKEHSGSLPLALDRKLARDCFPRLSGILPESQLAVLTASTRIVGMECPGLHSVYADLAVTFDQAPGNATPEVTYRATRVDPRMALVRLAFEGAGAKGEITALVRPEPVSQPTAAAVAAQVAPQEFAGQRALVIGGSRGLGETTAKLICMGGGEAVISYGRGREDAARIASDIASAGGRCGSMPFDVKNPPASLAEADIPDGFRPTHIYFFATPSIQLAKGGGFSDAKFAAYCDFYVAGVNRTIAAVDRLFGLEQSPLHLLYPSTVFIDELPPGAAEYAAAKAAGEVACRALARSRKNMRVSCPRLPMLKTDQTNSLRGSNGADPVPVLLSMLREMK